MKISSLTPSLALLSFSLLPSVQAWGGLGHQTIAFIASNFVQPKTQNYFQALLGNSTNAYLANVATWADSFRYTQAGRFSASFHFIDSQDNPPSSCGVKYDRDCGSTGCVVAAIQNYTSRLMDPELPQSERLIAAKFIVHFIGDIHQPLHDEYLDRGGNSINVTFDGTSANLHAIWDTNMPEKLIGGYSLADAQMWAATLSTAIKSGLYEHEAENWLIGMNLADPVSSSLVWATESNAFVCSTVIPDGPDAVEGQELGGDYYETAVPVIQLQIAKAGFRLAAWLDLIVGIPKVGGEL